MISNTVIQIVLQIMLAGYRQVLRILKETHVKQCIQPTGSLGTSLRYL